MTDQEKWSEQALIDKRAFLINTTKDNRKSLETFLEIVLNKENVYGTFTNLVKKHELPFPPFSEVACFTAHCEIVENVPDDNSVSAVIQIKPLKTPMGLFLEEMFENKIPLAFGPRVSIDVENVARVLCWDVSIDTAQLRLMQSRNTP